MGTSDIRDQVLVLDDDSLVLRALDFTLNQFFTVHTALSGAQALALLERHSNIAVAVIDQRMPGMSGPEFIRHTAAPYPNLVRIILTGYQDIDSLKAAINNGGAYRYLEKPCANEELIEAVHQAVQVHHRLVKNTQLPVALASANEHLREENQRLQLENLQLHSDVDARYRFGAKIVGSSPALRRVLVDAERVLSTDTTVLITGETGTGKELLARYLHDNGPRRESTFRAQNCGAVAEALMEDTLFGHIAGAFTGARALKKGLFEIADEGTLFLDEIGDCPLTLQTKLLRVVEEKIVHRLGDDEQALAVNVRLVAATNRDLRQEVNEKRFREDLYYRLNVFCLRMPALRERREDIPELVAYFIGGFNERARTSSGKRISGITPQALALLSTHEFPGNVRELANVIERAWLYADDAGQIGPEHLTLEPSAAVANSPVETETRQCDDLAGPPLKTALIAFKADFIRRTLARNDWNVAKTARELGITRGTLYEEMKECGVQRPVA